MRGLSLKYKFILITTVSIVVLMGGMGYMTVQREKDVLYHEVEKQGRLLGETLAIPIINDLIYERLGLVEEGGLLDNYILEIYNKRDVDLLRLAILDEDGKVISHNDITEYGKVYDDAFNSSARKSEKVIVGRSSGGEHNALDFGVPLSIGKKRWGTLTFAISLEKVEHEINLMLVRIALTTLVVIIAGFGLILLLSRRFISPITQLANAMEGTRGEDLDVKVEVKGHDELAVLGERFNSMIERIRQANEEVKKAHEKMVQSEKLASIGILASGVAHEINNPLGGIFNCIRMLEQNPDDPALREKYTGLINEGLGRIESTVNKLLWMSRKSEHKPSELNLRDVTASVYAFVEYRMRQSGIRLENEVPEGFHVFADMHDLQQIILNLFINAIQAMEGGGVLEVNGSRDNGSASMVVTDTGCGIPKENMNRIFDPFFTTKPTGEGTGLGLWLTYEIMRNYKGDIRVHSEEGQGCRFTLTFPAPDRHER
jgi:signal transduction histidine kinase